MWSPTPTEEFGDLVPVRHLAAAVAAAVALLLLGQTTAVADPAPPAATDLALSAPSTGSLHGTVPLTATLTSAGAPVADASIRFERHQSDGTWTALGTVATGADGTASYDAPVTQPASSFRASYDGDEAHAASVSPAAGVTGQRQPTVLAIDTPASVVDEHEITITLRWRSVESDERVPGTITVYLRKAGGSWKAWHQLVPGADGTVSFTATPRYDTWWKATGAAGTWWQGDDTDVAHYVDNQPPGDPVSYPSDAPDPDYIASQSRTSLGPGANASVSTITTSVWNNISGISWHSGCPVGRSGLRMLRVNYWGFNGYRYRGALIVNKNAASRFKAAFQDLYASHVPIRRMYRVDKFGYGKKSGGGNDYKSMRHDNTSAFNCRWVTGRHGVRSPHSYGYALDLNTWENPYHSAEGWLPDVWWHTRSQGKIAWRSSSSTVVTIMRDHGFRWTYGTEDSQHFDATNGPSLAAAAPCVRFCD